MISSSRSSASVGAAQPDSPRSPSVLIALGLAVPTALYFALLSGQTVNVPLGDDYVSLLPFLTSWHATNSSGGKLSLLWEQYFSHRIVCTRLAAVLVDMIHGDLQLVWLKVLGWCGWCALLVSLVFSQNVRKLSPFIAFSVAALLMQPQGTSNLFIAMQAIQHMGALVFALWSFQLLAGPSPTAFAGAIILAIGAMLSSANGLFVFPVAALTLWLCGQRQRAITFSLFGVVAWAVFFFHYRFEHHPFSLLEFLTNAAAMLGAWVTLGRYGVAVAVTAGVVIGMIAVGILVQRRRWQSSPATMAFLLYVLASVAMVALARIGWTADYMLQDRYRIYGMLSAATLGLLVIPTVDSPRRKILTAAFLTLSTISCAAAYYINYPALLLVGESSRATAMNRQLGRLNLQPGNEDIWAVAAENLVRAEQAGVYQPPRLLSAADLRVLQRMRDQPADGHIIFKAVRSIGDQGYVLTPTPDSAALPVPELIVAWFPEGPLLLAISRMRLSVSQIILRRQILSDSFACIIAGADYHSGKILLYGLSRDAAGQLSCRWTATAECP